MKTRAERNFIEASIIGDSHAMTVWKHLAPALAFRHSMTAAAKYFDGRFFSASGGELHITSDGLRHAFPRASDEIIEVMGRARERLDIQLQTVIRAGLPVISSVGAASYRFTRKIVATDLTGLQVLSNKMLRAAAAAHAENFVSFHAELRKHVPSVTFMLGACRYPDNQKETWLSYDQVIAEHMTEIGLGLIDVRPETGDTELRMLPEFEADDVLHGNSRWSELVAGKIFAAIGSDPRIIQETPVA